MGATHASHRHTGMDAQGLCEAGTAQRNGLTAARTMATRSGLLTSSAASRHPSCRL